mmetsp:Transcript_24662/g.76803  ORF Transcript_24662/g.76803 Transcript_24662/m.76803 type:complete len:303 (-) Transcript_24662:39-947(-)
MLGRAGVHGPDHELQLRQDRLGLIGAAADDVQHANALTVKPEVLREGLAHEHLEAHGEEEPDRESILVEAARSVALVRAVHQRRELLLLHEIRDLLPLVLGGVDARGVVRAGVEEDHGTRCGALQRGHHALKVQGPGLRLVVGVGLHREPRDLEDGVVVAPRGVGDPDLVHFRLHVRLDELGHNTQRAGARQGLHRGDAALLDGGRVRAKNELLRHRFQVRRAVDGAVLLVDAGAQLLEHLLLGLLNDLEHERLAILRAVGADPKIDLLGVGVSVVCQGRAKDGVNRCHSNVLEERHGSRCC